MLSASMSFFTVFDSAKSFGMPLNWERMLSRPSAMETGSWKMAVGA